MRQVRENQEALRTLLHLTHRFTPGAEPTVEALAEFNPDAALDAFIAAFQRDHFELDDNVTELGFDTWVEMGADVLPLQMRGADRCNGIDPRGFRPGYALQWVLIEDVFNGDERSEVIAEVADVFGDKLADRLAAADPPPHRILCRRLARSPFLGIVRFSQWALGDVSNPLLFHHAHHADELRIPWTQRGVARAAALIRHANNLEAPTHALARWLENAPRNHGPVLADAVLGDEHAPSWTSKAVRSCQRCGYPPVVRRWEDATSEYLFLENAHRERPGELLAFRLEVLHDVEY
jgi:hypothetical protein